MNIYPTTEQERQLLALRPCMVVPQAADTMLTIRRKPRDIRELSDDITVAFWQMQADHLIRLENWIDSFFNGEVEA